MLPFIVQSSFGDFDLLSVDALTTNLFVAILFETLTIAYKNYFLEYIFVETIFIKLKKGFFYLF